MEWCICLLRALTHDDIDAVCTLRGAGRKWERERIGMRKGGFGEACFLVFSCAE